uniref:Alcohol dehydrogenase-like C-terminal domain-containing protein n=1 Tax=Corethron hystrix TaxID=216773 RepID=A0A6U5E324_9STRA|mmetsp:Transcript_15247/g.34143  ORF Transcript_15247/g.34143 Transcript_15247/m.34143 type:complete len:421 (+) Transcript_15247:1916-3178(+)
MTYFFATSPAATEMMQGGWDMPGWFRRLRQHRPDIMARNVDLLFTLPLLGGTAGDLNFVEQKHGEENCRTKSIHMQELLFTGPRKVEVATKECFNHIGDDQVEVEAIMSLISSGTELTVFTGAFDVDAALDVNIGEMASQSMSYPLAYGYCMVGRVVRIGKEVTTPLLGKRVFCFAPHATRAVVDASSVQLLPQNVDTRDAIFLPSVETALSLVHEAGVRAGEAVAVFGQGLIGLLVTAVLAMTLGGGEEGSGYGAEGHVPVTAFDMLDERLMVSGALGASQAVRPSVDTKLFDIAIEVSGSPRGLQSAIDRTVEGGRIVVGSWYGKKEVALKLGIDFHRSHKTLVASQVSQIPAALAGTWDKKRRFAFAWEIVQRMRPSRYLLTKVVGLTSKEAQEAYLSLERGEEIAVAFDYGLENRQ